jgi:hypothetical protein
VNAYDVCIRTSLACQGHLQRGRVEMQKVFDNISCLEAGTFHLSLPVAEDIFEERYF